MYKVGFRKPRAACGYRRGIRGFQCCFAEVLNGDIKPRRLIGDKCARAGCAESVHCVIGHDTAAENDDFGILPADFEYRSYIGMDVSCSYCVSGDFVLYHCGVQHSSDELSCTAGSADGGNSVVLGVELRLQKTKQLFHRLQRISLSVNVFPAKQVVVLINDCSFC